MGRTITGRTRRYLLAGALCAVSLMAGADVTNVTVKVTVVAAACTVNDNKAIEVNFGDVATNRVNGTNYRKPVSYTLSCSGGTGNAMKLQVQGTGAAFDGSLLHTSVSGLGIRMQNGSSNLPVNQWVNFTYPDKPALWAVPVKQSGVTLSGGKFTAAATLKVTYQ